MKPWKGFEYTMARVNGLLKVRRRMSKKQGRGRATREVSDVLRSALVLAVSAFDAYCHDCLAFYGEDSLARILNSGSVPEELQKFIKENFNHAQLSKMLAASDPRKEFITAFIACYAARSFQDMEKVDKVFGLLGIQHIWLEVAVSKNEARKDLAERMAGIFNRRHSIVHSGDFVEGAQGKPKQKPIYAKTVEEDIQWLETVTKAFDDVIRSHLERPD